MDFKESPFMYILGGIVVLFVIAQSLFFLIRAWKQGKKIGLSTKAMRSAVTQSALFSIAPAISIVVKEPQTTFRSFLTGLSLTKTYVRPS